MTTRREFTQGSLAALFMASLGAAKVEAHAVEFEASVSELDALIHVRDTLRAMNVEPNSSYGFHVLKAAWELDHSIMRRCPHDPDGYVREPDEEIAGRVYPGNVSCPHCRATTYIENAKTSINEAEGLLW